MSLIKVYISLLIIRVTFYHDLVINNQMQMQELDVEKLILSKQYKNSPEFNSNPKPLLKLINYVKNLPVQQRSFDIIYDLIKFYRTPIFIAFQAFYERLEKQSKSQLQKYQSSINDIAVFVKSYLENNTLEELKFFYILGVPKKKKKMPEMSKLEKQFINYIQNLGQQLRKLKNQINSINKNELKLEIDTILAGGLDRKLNTLQMYYEQYFKNEADKLYKQYVRKNQQDADINQSDSKYLQPRPEQDVDKKPTFLCCRTFFYDRQQIKQAENLVIEYKNYFLPLKDQQLKILKKTVCAFLNTDGGTIYLGIQEDVNTKKRQIIGMQLNEAEKQNLIFILRKQVISCVQPDIIANKNYNISFVPVKQSNHPYHYISGRYLAKISVGYGLRNQIYSYRHEDRDYFAFRTENEVIHKEGRAILNAYRQRLKKPLPIPSPIHPGPCPPPQQGRPIINQIARQDFPTLIVAQQQQKPKYKQKEAMDFIITKMEQKSLYKQLASANIVKQVTVSSYQKQKILFIKINSPKVRFPLIQMLSKLESEGQCQFFETQRGVSIDEEVWGVAAEWGKKELEKCGFNFNINQKRKAFQFKTTEDAVQAFLIIKYQMKLNASFIGV